MTRDQVLGWVVLALILVWPFGGAVVWTICIGAKAARVLREPQP